MAADILWVGYPKSYTEGRRRPIQFVTLHYTAGSEGPMSAEGGAAYDKRRTDGTSTHYFTDSQGPALQEVPDGDRAHTARRHGNEIGIHIEICGTKQTRNQWLDPVSSATLKTTAALVADLCKRHGLPVKRLTTAETRAAYYAAEGKRPKGINDHYACTYAFPEDNGDHEDVGPAFPWDVFLVWVKEFYEEDEMSGPTTQQQQQALKDAGFYAGAIDGIWGPQSQTALTNAYKSKGPKGDKGDPGTPGAPGKDGEGFAPGETVTVTGTVTVNP